MPIAHKIKSYKVFGFTLAEVLITLVVIGIIAAMTVPIIMSNYKKIETASKLKKAYTTINNAIKLSQTENGLSATEWEYAIDEKEFFEKYLAKYFNYIKITPTSNSDYPTYDLGLYAVYLNDGTVLGLDGGSNYKVLLIDINGEKKPNESGRDIFSFEMDTTNGLCSGNSGMTRLEAIQCCKENLYCCAQIIMADGWEIKDDYPFKL